MTIIAREITRRRVLAALATSAAAPLARSAPSITTSIEEIDVAGARIQATRYSTSGVHSRPTVLLLHGSRGLAPHFDAYDRYARDLAGVHIDTLLFTYFRSNELAEINTANGSSEREKQYAISIDGWVALVRAVARAALAHERSSGEVGLLGFSLGGYVAVAAASRPLFSAMAVLYTGLPNFYGKPIKYLPPVLDIHGDADQSVPLTEGANLVAAAKHLGGVSKLIVFAHEGHGFDLDPSNKDAASARRQAIAFLKSVMHPTGG